MKYRRVIRDLGILSLFCIGFFLVTRVINLLGEEHVEPVQVEFSEARRMADREINSKNYNAAIRFLTQLTQEDEFNSHAWYRMGWCYLALYEQSKKPSLADPTPYSRESRLKQREFAEKSVAAFTHVIDYPRYRSTAMLQIAAFHVLEGQPDAAFDMLNRVVEFKAEIPNPDFILRDPFTALAGDPRYENIKTELLRNAPKNNRYRRGDGIGVSGSPVSSEAESGETSK